MAYAANILPVEAAYYTLQNASIANAVMTVNAGGSAVYNVTTADLAVLTDTFRVSLLVHSQTSGYSPQVLVRLSAVTIEGTCYDYAMIPSGSQDSLISYELDMEAAEYTSLVFSIEAQAQIVLYLWELCPEASEEIDMTIIEGVTQSLPKLLSDYNVEPLVIQQDELTIALITFDLLQNTDLQGHFAITCVATETCILTLRFKDTGVTELYSPMHYDLRPGRSTIGIPHAYLSRLAGYHSTYITAQVSTGIVSVGTRAILYTIDGGYLATRIADLGILTEDITLNQFRNDYEPDYVYVIGIDAGQAMVRRRAYSAKAHIAFDPLYTIGPAKHAAIECNGHWILRTDMEETIYALVTEEDPYIFLVDTDDNLVVQVGNDATTRITLDTGVSTVSACRGYDSIIYTGQDQGLICLYIKANALFYCQYCYTDGQFLWIGPFEIIIPDMIGTLQSAYVHRLNDYRVSIVVTTSEANYWLISSRTYVGQTVKPDQAYFTYDKLISTMAMYPAAQLPTPLQIIDNTILADGKTVEIVYDRPVRITDAAAFIDEIEVVSGTSRPATATALGNVLTIVMDETITLDSLRLAYPLTMYLQSQNNNIFWAPAPAATILLTGNTALNTVSVSYVPVVTLVLTGKTTVPHSQWPETVALDYVYDLTLAPQAFSHDAPSQYPVVAAITYDVAGIVAVIRTGVSPI